MAHVVRCVLSSHVRNLETPFFFFALPDLFIEGHLFPRFVVRDLQRSAHLEESDGPGFDLADDPG